MSSAAAATFSGDLGLLGPFDLGQLLMLNGATGRLVVESEGRRGYLFFEDGHIVNAVDDEQREGEGAAYRIFTWKTGRFEFRPEPPGAARVIQEGTGALLLEAARRIDEAGEAAGPAGGQEARLRDRQNAMEELRDVFRRLAREAQGAEEAAAEPASQLLEALRDVDDRLLCQRGRPPRLLHDGSWLVAGEEALSPEVYEDLRARLLGETKNKPPPDEAGTAGSRTVALEGGRTVHVTRVPQGADEVLWIRLARLPSPDPALLDGPHDRLLAVLDVPQGLLIAGAPSVDATERLVNALVPLLVRRRGGTVLLVTDTPVYEHRDHDGVVLRVAPETAPAALTAVAPGAVVFDASRPASQAVAQALRVAPLVVAAAVAADSESALPRWLAGAGAAQREAIEALLATGAVGVVYTPGVPIGEDRIPFTARFASLGPALPAPDPETSPR